MTESNIDDALPSDTEGREWIMNGLKKSGERLEEYLEKNQVQDPEKVRFEPDQNSDRDPKVKKIDKRAVEDGYLSGKWELFVCPDKVDEVWMKIKELISEYKIWGGQVTTDWIREKRDLEEHTIRVYTPNYLDEADVLRVGNLLKKRCDIEKEICYKPDIYNVLQVYSDEGEDIKLPEEIRYRI